MTKNEYVLRASISMILLFHQVDITVYKPDYHDFEQFAIIHSYIDILIILGQNTIQLYIIGQSTASYLN